MITFLALAALLLVIAVGLIAVPLLKPVRSGALPSARWTALACAAVLLLGSALLYAKLSIGPSGHPSSASPQTMVERLVRHLGRHPGDLDGWMMLGRSYVVLKEYPLALRAYQQADRVAGGKNADALLGEAETLILINGAEFLGHAGRLIERALVLAPHDPQALFFGAAAALHRGDLPLARARFNELLALNPPAPVKTLVEQELSSIDGKHSPGASVADPAAAQAGAAADPPAIRVTVRLAPALAGRAPPAAPLYVFVEDPRQPGPPLAVKRLSSRFPRIVQLTTADAMIPGRVFTSGERVEVIARIAPSGNPMDASGDLSGEAPDRVGQGPITVLINHVTP
jgi:cytochrome c-type biogenesis protein CcmH